MKNNMGIALSYVLKHEGGFSDHPSDPGGATNKGVTLAVFRRFYGQDQTVSELKQINDEQLQHIYRDGYWDKCLCDQLPAGVDYCVFDAAVNSGPGRGARWLQGAVGATQDGAVGPRTLAKVGEHNPLQIINDLCDRRLLFLQSLSTWSVFGKGWGRRVDEMRHKAIAMANGQTLDISQTQPNIEYDTVKLGSKGPWVSRLQSALEIDVDGIFGKKTEKALIEFQINHALQADGIAGRNTYRALGLLP